jgi:YkoY family integral membrane protein
VLLAAYLLQWVFVKFLGGAYLVYIAVKHLYFENAEEEDEEEEKVAVDEAGRPQLVDSQTGEALSRKKEEHELAQRLPVSPAPPPETAADRWRFWRTVGAIELTDIAFAVDSILAAIALAGGRSEKLWVIITGGILGMIMMRFAAAVFIRLLERFPRFELSAYLLVIAIGLKLLLDWGFNSDWSFDKQPFVQNRLGAWKQTFKDVEVKRRELVASYDKWLKDHWIFKVQHEQHKAPAAAPAGPPVAAPAGRIKAPEHVPHLLDFHDLRFPECMAFWLIMIGCFGIGFIPQRRDAPPQS